MKKNQTIRLNKYISECGFASRRKAEEFILEGRVFVNGKRVESLSEKIDPYQDEIKIDGEKLLQKKKLYFLLNKPKGYITSTKDEKNRKTVVELIKTKEKIFPVGRLDYDTTGVLLLTNDGEFTNLMTHPSNQIPREYIATLDYPLEEPDKMKLLKGIYIDRRKGKFIKISFASRSNYYKVIVTVVEGRNRFVKRMFGALGYNVVNLDRKSYAGFCVKDIPVGSYRKLSYNEINDVVKKYS
ncbi:pseudouridine synthase [Bacteroidota bacterium]